MGLDWYISHVVGQANALRSPMEGLHHKTRQVIKCRYRLSSSEPRLKDAPPAMGMVKRCTDTRLEDRMSACMRLYGATAAVAVYTRLSIAMSPNTLFAITRLPSHLRFLIAQPWQ